MDNQRLIKYLNQLLANTVIMERKLLRYYWYGQGPEIEHLREIFIEGYNKFEEFTLDIGERILIINGRPLATLAKYLAEATIEEASAEQYIEEMMEQLEADLGQIINDIEHEGLYLAKHLKDQQTCQLLTHILQDLQHQQQQIKSYQNKF